MASNTTIDIHQSFLLDLFAKRRSCRSFRKDKLSDEVLEKIIYAGRLAPSAHGSEDTFTIQIEDQEARKRIEERTSMFIGGFKDPFYRAPHVLAVLSLRDANTGCGAFDGALVLGNMMFAAAALGVGSCWINTAQLDTMTDDSVLLSLMASKGFGSVAFDGIGYLALGYPASDDFFKQPRKVPRYSNRTIKI